MMARQYTGGHGLVRPDGLRGWIYVVAGHFLLLTQGGMVISCGVLYVHMLSRYGATAATTAGVVALFSGLRFIAGPLATLISNWSSQRVAIVIGGFMLGVSLTLAGFATQIWQAFICYGFAGIGGGVVTVAVYTFIPQYFDKRRSLALGVMQMGVGSGAFIYPFVVNYLLDEYGYQGTLMLLGGFNFNIMVCGAILQPPSDPQQLTLEDAIVSSLSLTMSTKSLSKKNRPTEDCLLQTGAEDGHKDCTEGNFQNDSLLDHKRDFKQSSSTMNHSLENGDFKGTMEIHQSGSSNVKTRSFRCISRTGIGEYLHPTFILFVLVSISFVLCVFTLLGFLPALCREHEIEHNHVALILGTIGISEFAATLPCGFALDIAIINRHRRHFYTSFLILFSLTIGLNGFVTQPYVLAILGGMQGCLKGIGFGQLSVVIADLFGIDKMAKIFGFIWGTMGIFNITWPFIVGLLRDVLGSYQVAYYIAGGMGIFFSTLFELQQILTHHTKFLNNRGP